MDNDYNDASDLFTTVKSTTGGDIEGGNAFSKNANRALGWFIAGIVASIIVSILLMLVAFVFGLNFNVRSGQSSGGSVVLIGGALLLSLGVGFATAGSVYESWVGCSGPAE
jgi:hypothetical protein